jgi:hypothetical protein
LPRYGANASMKILTIILLATLLGENSYADYTWKGTKDSNFSTAENWDSAPSANSSNQGGLFVANGSGAPLLYTVSQGATTFEGQFLVGTVGTDNSSSMTGSLTISGGTLTVDGTVYGAIIGQTQKGTLNVSGGNLNLTGGQATFLGNSGDGTINLSGGVVTLDAGLVIGRNSATGGNYGAALIITGGKFIVQGETSFDVKDGDGDAGGTGLKKIEFGAGTGIFTQTTSGTLSFPQADDAGTAYVNFVSGSKGQLSLFGATQAYFEGLVQAGRIRIDGQPAKTTSFKFSMVDKQGVYALQ